MDTALLQKQELKLVMTEQLLKSIELLQYSSFELMQFIAQQQQEHPLIEIKESKSRIRISKNQNRGYSGIDAFLENTLQSAQDFRSELYELAKITFEDSRQLQVLYFIIFNLDDNGYLQIDDFDLVVDGFSAHEVEQGVILLQQIGPPGIGGKDLAQCLLLQMDKGHDLYKVARRILLEAMPLLAEKKWKQLARQLQLSVVKVKEVAQYIKTFEPRPCASLSHQQVELLIPDIIVTVTGGVLSYRLNDYYFSDVNFNEQYISLMQQKGENANFVNNQYKIYQWLRKSIESRKNTIMEIMDVVVREQQDFFKHGYTMLKPLKLKDVAEEIGMHESTISRATKNKAVQTSFGTVMLRQLFTSKLNATDGQAISQTTIKEYIKQLVALENKQRPLADQKIAETIEMEYSVVISRRTVNKYRQEMRIPNVKERKITKN